MARPHIEYIQSQMLPWIPVSEHEIRAGADYKILSQDPDTGACSLLMRYPAGFTQNLSHYFDADEEFYVLDGSFTLGDVDFIAQDYAYLPNGYPRKAMISEDGAVILTFFEKKALSSFGNSPAGVYDDTGLIERIRSSEMDWTGIGETNVVGPDIGRKAFRYNPETGDRTWILKVGPTDPNEVTESKIETHPCVEEMYLLEGSISMPNGVLRSGAYFWRPPGIPHGPFGCHDGSIGFFRTKDGEFLTDWSEHAEPIEWNAPYNPTLPDDVQEIINRSRSQETPSAERSVDRL